MPFTLHLYVTNHCYIYMSCHAWDWAWAQPFFKVLILLLHFFDRTTVWDKWIAVIILHFRVVLLLSDFPIENHSVLNYLPFTFNSRVLQPLYATKSLTIHFPSAIMVNDYLIIRSILKPSLPLGVSAAESKP